MDKLLIRKNLPLNHCFGLAFMGLFILFALISCADETNPAIAPSVEELQPTRMHENAGSIAPTHTTANDASQTIIKRARLSIKVGDFFSAKEKLLNHLRETNGFVQRNEQVRESKDAFSATMILKVPVSSYDGTIAFLKNLGEIYELFEQTEHVGLQAGDLRRKLDNQKRLEERMLSILENRDGSLKEVIAVERELSKIRGKIEAVKDKIDGLNHKIDYAQFTIHLFVTGSREQRAKTWWGPLSQDVKELGFVVAGSIGALLTVIVAVLPWILFFYALIRWRKNRKRKENPLSTPGEKSKE